MDKQLQELLAQLVQFVQDKSPIVWEMAMKQVYTKIVLDIFWGLVFLIVAVLAYKSFRHFYKVTQDIKSSDHVTPWEWENTEIAFIISALISVATFFFFLVEIGLIISYVMNPQYYALKILMGLAK